MRCPNCDGENFDIFDMDFSLPELYVILDLSCDGCGKVLVVEFGLKVEEIKEVD